MLKPASDGDELANRPEERTTTQHGRRHGNRLAVDRDDSDRSWGKTLGLSMGPFFSDT